MTPTDREVEYWILAKSTLDTVERIRPKLFGTRQPNKEDAAAMLDDLEKLANAVLSLLPEDMLARLASSNESPTERSGK